MSPDATRDVKKTETLSTAAQEEKKPPSAAVLPIQTSTKESTPSAALEFDPNSIPFPSQLAEIKVTTGDTLYGVVSERKLVDGFITLKLDGVVRKDARLSLIQPPVKISVSLIREAKRLKNLPFAFPRLMNATARCEANKLATVLEGELFIGGTSTCAPAESDKKSSDNNNNNNNNNNNIKCEKGVYMQNGRVIPESVAKQWLKVEEEVVVAQVPRQLTTPTPPISVKNLKKKDKSVKKEGNPHPAQVEEIPRVEEIAKVEEVAKVEETVKTEVKEEDYDFIITDKVGRRTIHDPEDSDFEVEIEDGVEEGDEFMKECEPTLSDRAAQSLRDASKQHVLNPKVSDMLFRLDHHQIPLVVQMSGADLQMLSMLKTQPRKDASWLGFAKSTSDEHLNVLKLFASNVRPQDSLIDALIDAIEKLRVIREWRWSTTLKRAASLQGALAILPLYFKGSIPILLKHSPDWVKQLSHYSKKAKEEAPKQAKPTTAEQVNEAILKFRKRNIGIAVALMLGWLTAGRLGCILQLQVEDVRINQQRFSVTFRRGKGVRLRGPYTVYSSPLPDQWMEIWKQFIETRKVKLFSEAITGKKLKEALREVDCELEQRSIRRGALQTMAVAGTSEENLMRFSGHTQVKTLHRYLNWNQLNSKVESTMAATAVALLPEDPKSKKQTKGDQSSSTKPSAPKKNSSSARSAPPNTPSSTKKVSTRRK